MSFAFKTMSFAFKSQVRTYVDLFEDGRENKKKV